MARTGWLRMDGIEDESSRSGHEGEIDIHGVHWAVMRPDDTRSGSGRDRSRASVENLTCHKSTDAASVYLALACMQGRSFPEAVLTLRKESAGTHLDYLIVTMTNCTVTGFETENDGAGPGDGDLRESVSLAFERIKILYTEQDDDASGGNGHEIDYDITAGR